MLLIVFIIRGLLFTTIYIPVYIFSIEGKSGTPIKVVISTWLDFEHFFWPAVRLLVSFAAVIRVVTRHATLLPTSGEERCLTSDDPNNGCEGDYEATRLYSLLITNLDFYVF